MPIRGSPNGAAHSCPRSPQRPPGRWTSSLGIGGRHQSVWGWTSSIGFAGRHHSVRPLDRLFDADRTALLTDVVVAVGERFGIEFTEFHNDSTTISFYGAYHGASGRKIRGRTSPAITYGLPHCIVRTDAQGSFLVLLGSALLLPPSRHDDQR